MTDETYSLVLEDPEEGEKPEKWYTSISALDQTYWTLGSVIGAIAGQIIPFDLTGLEFAMTALFTVVVTEQTSDAYKNLEGRTHQYKTFCRCRLSSASDVNSAESLPSSERAASCSLR